MFDTLFKYDKVLARHQDGPAAEERERYLVHRASCDGVAPSTLLRVARETLAVARQIDLSHGDSVTPGDIAAAAQRWAMDQLRKGRSNGVWSRQLFTQVATDWLRFIGRLAEPSIDGPGRFSGEIERFFAHMRDERGLSATTVKNRRWHVERFLRAACAGKESIADITIADVDGFLDLEGQQGWCRASLTSSAGALRTFFRYAERHGWCRPGIAAAIDSPRLFKQEGLPNGPAWMDVQRLVASTDGPDPRDVRDHAILMLFAVYGLRSGEVRRLRLQDLDWTKEVISVERSKQQRIQYYPLVSSVGNAILQYITNVRPCVSHRQIFLTLKAPIRPLSPGALHYAVSSRIKRLGIPIQHHHGPHCLRHACASHLVAAGLSLKEIGDHLGHSNPYATRVYAKVDLAGLRQVADFDLRGLL
jgi:site-specific recombinase XerD